MKIIVSLIKLEAYALRRIELDNLLFTFLILIIQCFDERPEY